MSGDNEYPRSTGQFAIPGLLSDCKVASAIYNSELHVLGAQDTNLSYRAHYITHVKFPLDKLVADDDSPKVSNDAAVQDSEGKPKDWDEAAVQDPANWETVISWDDSGSWWASGPRDFNGTVQHSDNMALFATPAALWAFYVWSDGGALSLRCRKYQAVEGTPGKWGSQIQLFNPDKTLAEDVAAVGACAFGDTQILVAVCGTAAETNTISLYLFDTRDVDLEKSTWTARSRRVIDVEKDITYYMGSKVQPRPAYRIFPGIRMDVDWVCTSAPGEESAKYLLAVGFAPSIPWNEGYTWTGFVPLQLSTKSGEEGALADDPWGRQGLEFFNQGDGLESSLMRDPSGRLQRYTRYRRTDGNQQQFQAIYFSTAEPPTVQNGFGAVIDPNVTPAFLTASATTYASGTFYLFLAGQRKTAATGKDINAQPLTVDGATEYPILEFVFHGPNSCQLHDYGRLVVAPSQQYEVIDAGSDKKVLVGGYFDSPIPIPVQNFVGQPLSNNELEVGTFAYNITREKEEEFGLETGWSVGVEAEFKTSEGVGPAFKLAVEDRVGSVENETTASEIKREISVGATVKSYDGFEDPYVEKSTIASAVRAQFKITGYQFYDSLGNLVNDALSGDKAQSLKMGAVLPRMVNADNPLYSFDPYIVTPGDLNSYTAPRINQRMKELGYAGENYFGEVICRNALPLSGNPYLALGWTRGNPNRIETVEVRSSFVEQSVDLDTSGAVGASGGGGFDFFGIGEKFEFSAMITGSYSRERSQAEMERSGWGLDLSEGWGPIVPREDEYPPDSVASYSFRVYFLPVPRKPSELPRTYWAEELAKYLPKTKRGPNDELLRDMVFRGAACWRIAFVVTSIECFDENSKCNYNHAKFRYLDRESVYG